jgi:hypothetical protein
MDFQWTFHRITQIPEVKSVDITVANLVSQAVVGLALIPPEYPALSRPKFAL